MFATLLRSHRLSNPPYWFLMSTKCSDDLTNLRDYMWNLPLRMIEPIAVHLVFQEGRPRRLVRLVITLVLKSSVYQ